VLDQRACPGWLADMCRPFASVLKASDTICLIALETSRGM
jgi:hypothetical protein